MKDHLELKAYAKINLGLDVVRKREDGYHEVRMIMQTVNLYDRIEMDRNGDGVIKTETNLPFVPDGEGNLAWRAAKLLLDEKRNQGRCDDKDPEIYPCCGRYGRRQYRRGGCFSRCEPDV